MRSVPGGLLTMYQSQFQTFAFCVMITLANRQPRVVHITNANPGVVTTMWPHRLMVDDVVKFVDIEGMTAVNFIPVSGELYFRVTEIISPTEFAINQDTTAYPPYLLGSTYGTARRVLGFTEYETDLVVNNVILRARTGARETAVESNSDMSFSSREVQGVLNSDLIRERDIEEGYYSNAEVETFEVNYKNLAAGRHVLTYGRIGEVTWGDLQFTAEIHGLLSQLGQHQGPQISVTCRAQLGTRIKAPISTAYPPDERFGCKVRLNPPQWLPTTGYTAPLIDHDAALGSVVKASAYNGLRFICTQAGTSGGVEPAWNTTIGGTTSDGTIIWTTAAAFTLRGTVTGVTDQRTFTDFNRTELSGWFTGGLLTFITGQNPGFSTEVRTYGLQGYPLIAIDAGSKFFYVAGNQTANILVGDTIEIVDSGDEEDPVNDGSYTVVSVTYEAGPVRTKVEVAEAIPSNTVAGTLGSRPAGFLLHDRTFRPIQVGDEYEVEVGCDKRLETCRDKFNNVLNMRAEPWIPGFHKQFLYPDAP